ncbi:lysosomal acid glucosylceramidase isoform X1 [Neodiprion lecontei]|uniref:Glucosylceramidase n=1 Tax=Neodiprion lecontei TaxID=441921 RepID=A0ABM3FVF3_NEOLC|nr:lysosomal acid glucosylceramidase isoform X1 [Neodiprion lecontei]
MQRFYLLLILWICAAESLPCVPRDFGNGGTVCVCNATYCDSTPELEIPEIGSFVRYVSSRDGLRLDPTEGAFTNESATADVTLQLDLNTTFQTIHGFGGAFTDATGINIKLLSNATADYILRSYFGEEGSRYNLGRVPIGGSDFSTRAYTYDDTQSVDMQLNNFSLAEEDIKYKIPLMQEALRMNRDLRFFASAWTAPPWMKTNNDYTGFGFLLEEYYQVYAEYTVKFMDEYKSYGLKMWAMTTGNEPSTGIIPVSGINSMGWTPSGMGKWVAENLGPTMSKSEHKDTIILAFDDQKFGLPWYVSDMFSNKVAKNYTAGIAFHWYWDSIVPSWVIDRTHYYFPEKFLIMTEASVVETSSIRTGDKSWEFDKVVLGSWERGEMYITDIMDNLQHWVTGWVDWNLALNHHGGPNWKSNFVDSAIIVNAENDEFYKQPMFYGLAHFSKFIPRGSVRLKLSQEGSSTIAVAFKTPDNKIVIVLYNTLTENQHAVIRDQERGIIDLQLPPKSIHTIMYK